MQRKSHSLSIRISLGLIVAAILPLLVTVTVSELFSRPDLTNQASTAMKTDARTHAQLLDSYLDAHRQEFRSLAALPFVQNFFLDPVQNQENIYLVTQNGGAAGSGQDPNIAFFVLFDLKAQPLIAFSTTDGKTYTDQKFTIPSGYMQRLMQGETSIVSSAYYNTITKKASVDIYTLSYSTQLKQPLGIVRTTLSLDYIWNLVANETGANGAGSYAFILDENKVRVADPNPANRLTAITPTGTQVNQTGTRPPVVADSALNSFLQQAKPATDFEFQPAGKQEMYHVVTYPLSSPGVHWTYFVLSPVNTVLAVANQQLIITVLVMVLILIPTALIGWGAGHRISYPILLAVDRLLRNSQSLRTLATKQKSAATEQSWVVDSTQTGLKSVEYYNNAAQVALRSLQEMGTNVLQRWDEFDEPALQQAVKKIMQTAQYISHAVGYQDTSNEQLSTAINVTIQVSEQLMQGATSATEASEQLEEVVNNLRQIVGG